MPLPCHIFKVRQEKKNNNKEESGQRRSRRLQSDETSFSLLKSQALTDVLIWRLTVCVWFSPPSSCNYAGLYHFATFFRRLFHDKKMQHINPMS